MLIRIRRSKLKIYCKNFNRSNAVVCSHLILAYTARLAVINAAELERNGWVFFFTFIEECCVVIEKNIDKKLANKISYQIWYKRCLKGKLGRGSKSAKGIHIRKRISTGGSKSAVTPDLKVSRSWHFDFTPDLKNCDNVDVLAGIRCRR